MLVQSQPNWIRVSGTGGSPGRRGGGEGPLKHSIQTKTIRTGHTVRHAGQQAEKDCKETNIAAEFIRKNFTSSWASPSFVSERSDALHAGFTWRVRNLVTRFVTPKIHLVTLIIHIIHLLAKSTDSPHILNQLGKHRKASKTQLQASSSTVKTVGLQFRV